MKIGHQNDPSVANTSNSQSAAAKVGPEVAHVARNERKAPSASVTVSALARGLDKESSTATDVDVEKVNAMKQALADKTYSVNAGAIADKLLANAREMLQRTSS
ncbi:MAG: flagellar biosynthesis anti-sigma factor FlgM [Betaproteobacteria bacterium]